MEQNNISKEAKAASTTETKAAATTETKAAATEAKAANVVAEEPKKRVVIDMDDVAKLSPWLGRHQKFTKGLFKFLKVDKVNDLHEHNIDNPGGGPGFVRGMLEELDIKLKIDNEEVLDNLPEGAFITVSNHHFGALDGIILIDIVAQRRPKFRVMVNMMLNYISGMRDNFIAVDALASDDPKKKAVSMKGIKQAIMQVRSGEPVGFFPAGAVAKVNWRLRLKDREWQPNIIRLIEQLKVPVVPIFFHGSQSWWFNFLGVTAWQLRSLRHPAEVFRKRHKTFHITVGQPISVEEQRKHMGSLEEFGQYLKETTYKLRDNDK
jgi:putative hemolysin